jgi:cytoskeletal protein CcmA (bactofilin family)
MAVFSEKNPVSGGSAREGVPGLSIIGAGMRVIGDISADGVVKIEGSVSGTVRAAKQVLVARGGEVEGDVVSREAIIGGDVRGAIYAEERVELQATSVVHGDVHTKRLLIQEGGEINGVLRMGEDAGQPPQPPVRQAASALARA